MNNIKNKIELSLRKILLANLEWYDKLPNRSEHTRNGFVNRAVAAMLSKYRIEERKDHKE